MIDPKSLMIGYYIGCMSLGNIPPETDNVSATVNYGVLALESENANDVIACIEDGAVVVTSDLNFNASIDDNVLVVN